MNYFLSTKQSVRTPIIQHNTQSKVGESTRPGETLSCAYCNYALDVTNVGLSYARLLHFLADEDQKYDKTVL